MTRRGRVLLAAALVPGLLGLCTGCRIGGQDDEMTRPTRTVTAKPTTTTTPVPARIPVGSGAVTPRDVVWGDASRLHVAKRFVDLSPASIDQLVVVPGGVYVLSDDELWFTDLDRLRGTGLTGVTDIAPSADGESLLVTRSVSGREVVHGYDVRTGRRVDLGSATSGTSSPSATPSQPATSPAGFKGYPEDFTLAGWSSGSTFYGVARTGGKPTAVVSCSVATRTCSTLAAIEGEDPVVFPHRA